MADIFNKYFVSVAPKLHNQYLTTWRYLKLYSKPVSRFKSNNLKKCKLL